MGLRFIVPVYEVHTDSEPLFTGTHDGPDGSNYLQSRGAMFKSLGAIVGVAVENETQGTIGNAALITEEEVVAGTGGSFPYTFPITFGTNVQWNNGDTYNIYKTSEKGSVISSIAVDKSRGWKVTRKSELDVRGWRPADRDIDVNEDGYRIDVFGPQQPEKNHG